MSAGSAMLTPTEGEKGTALSAHILPQLFSLTLTNPWADAQKARGSRDEHKDKGGWGNSFKISFLPSLQRLSKVNLLAKMTQLVK